MSLLHNAHGAATPLRSSLSHSPAVCSRPLSAHGPRPLGFAAKPLQASRCADREEQYDLTPPGGGGQLPPRTGRRFSGQPSEEPGRSGFLKFLYGCADIISRAGPGVGLISIGLHGLPALGFGIGTGIGCGIGTGLKEGLNGLGAGVGKGLQGVGTGLKEGLQGLGGGVKDDLRRVGADGQEGLPEITAGKEAGKGAAGGAAPHEGDGPRGAGAHAPASCPVRVGGPCDGADAGVRVAG